MLGIALPDHRQPLALHLNPRRFKPARRSLSYTPRICYVPIRGIVSARFAA